jgi:hypothetical protein
MSPEDPKAPAPPAPAEESAPGAAPETTAQRRQRSVAAWVMLLGVCAAIFVTVVLVGLKLTEERRLSAECRRNFELLGEAAGKYAEANEGRYPYGPRALEQLLLRYLRHRKFVVCPKGKRTYRWTARARRTSDPSHLLLAWESPRTPAHGIIAAEHYALFVGGKVRALSRDALIKLLREEAKEPPTPLPKPARPRAGLRSRPGEPPPGYLPKLPPGTRFKRPPNPEDLPGPAKPPKKEDSAKPKSED